MEAIYQYQLLPDLAADEYEALKADIARRGVQVPVEIDEAGAILDGHQRVRAWTELHDAGLPLGDYPRIIRAGFSEDQKFEHALILNLNRRHLTDEQRKELTRRLRERGWSTGRIAEVEKVSDETVRRDLSDAGSTYVEPARVTGRDGKSYPAHRAILARDEREAANAVAALPMADFGEDDTPILTGREVVRNANFQAVMQEAHDRAIQEEAARVERDREQGEAETMSRAIDNMARQSPEVMAAVTREKWSKAMLAIRGMTDLDAAIVAEGIEDLDIQRNLDCIDQATSWLESLRYEITSTRQPMVGGFVPARN